MQQQQQQHKEKHSKLIEWERQWEKQEQAKQLCNNKNGSVAFKYWKYELGSIILYFCFILPSWHKLEHPI